MNINELVIEAYKNACEKGWHDIARSPLEAHALIHSEIGEATEAARDDRPAIYQNAIFIDGEVPPYTHEVFVPPDGLQTPIGGLAWNVESKPEGEAIELADAVIRIADYFGERGWDLEQAIKLKMAYNKIRSHRHGNKKY